MTTRRRPTSRPERIDNPPIASAAGTIRSKLATAIKHYKSEEDLRIGMEILLRGALPDLPSPRYEQAIETSTYTGRADAVHRGVVIEYEKPRSLRTTRNRAHSIRQLVDYMSGLSLGPTSIAESKPPGEFMSEPTYSSEDEERLASHVGVVTDGDEFIFVQRRGRRWHEDSRKLDEDTIEKLLLWLRTMSRKDLSPENLIADFGPQTELATEIVGVLAELVSSGKFAKASVIYDEWKRIFGIVYGTEQLERRRRDPESRKLAAAYSQNLEFDFLILLFSVHTYYALLMKLLATEVIVAQGGLGSSFVGSITRERLREHLRALESGEILQRYGIRNAIEEDFFGWYPEAWTRDLERVLAKLITRMTEYDITTFELRPDRARDLLKDLYHGLIPEAVRHALGEYYTPDWLAEHTLDLAGYDGDPTRALLDPSCGSGTFLLLAIHRVRQWLADRPVEWGTKGQKMQAVRLIRRNVVGFDLNPLAVIASRTNYLFALGPLLRYREEGPEFEIPVYLTDSVLLPGRRAAKQDLFTPDTIPFPMTVGTFDIPGVIVERRLVPELMNLLHECITEGHDAASFVNRSIRNLKLATAQDREAQETLETSLETLFVMMKQLDRAGKNRVWAKLIRNRYAALLFRDYFDFIVGNPPHVNWESLTPEWRSAAEEDYRHYGLFTLTGLESRHGGGKKDIAALFTYAVMDHFLKSGGTLALVLHVSLFKTSGAGEGFRRFRLGDGAAFEVQEAHDFRSFQPFQTHSGMKIKTRTLTMRAVKGRETRYPVPYHVWSKTERGFIPGNLDWSEAGSRLSRENLVAVPLRGTRAQGRQSPWLTVHADRLPECRRVIAPLDYHHTYQAHAGIYTGGLNGAYFLEVLAQNPNGTILVRNVHDTGKIACPRVEATLEADLVHPLLRGRSVAKWAARPEGHVLILQDPSTQRGFPEDWLQETHPLTWAYIKKFEKLLRKRKAFLKFFDPKKDPFYSMYAVGNYTFARHKVVWMDVSSTMKAAVVSVDDGVSMPVPEHKLILIAAGRIEEAHYLAAVLNCERVNMVVSGYIVDNSVSTHPIDNIQIPKFNPADSVCVRLADLSKKAHEAARAGNDAGVEDAERQINEVVGSIWS